ncbi:MAG TPA: hypothetical protein VFN10_15835 [Thermoanaerobaculia bacterium]|nr:hypothetical protein [Thermoanaerobaculia bacterium]
MTTTCEQYFEDPEAHASHLDECEACRVLFGELDDDAIAAPPAPVRVDALPLAPWEGASHRTWPLVIAGVLSVAILAIVLFISAGQSPVHGIAQALVSAVPSLELLMNVTQMAGGALHNAPLQWHVAIAISFVVINTILFLLLRRAPKGIDV